MDIVHGDERGVSAAQTQKDRSSRAWIAEIEDAERCYRNWQELADKVDKQFGTLDKLAARDGDDEFQIFWANLQVLNPTVYSRPPVPVVAPRFKDRRPLPRKAAEITERALISDLEMDDVDTTAQLIRDDLNAIGRGAAWIEFRTEAVLEHGGGQSKRLRASVVHVERKDFLHSPARKWAEVDWVARRVYLTRNQMRQRFEGASGDTWTKAEYTDRSLGASGDDGDYRGEKKAEVWELWHRSERVVVWVCKQCDVVLDMQDPFLTLEGFFPCPRPAYATLERGTLIPIPDLVYYWDQVTEITDITARIAIVQSAIKVKGFYPAGSSDIGDAIREALDLADDEVSLIPIKSMAQLTTAAAGQPVAWMPVEIFAQVLQYLVELRRQMIEDVYQLTGLSDIMRGSTDADETARAQTLKAQYGTVRVKDRQKEMVRILRDIIRMKAEIMAELFPMQLLLEMSQVDDVPTAAELQQQKQAALQQLAQQAQSEVLQNGQPPAPDQMQQLQQMGQQAQAQVEEQFKGVVAIEQVEQLLRSQRMRPFVLEIETDSTIEPDEQAEKQARSELLTAFGGFFQAAQSLVAADPAAGKMVAQLLQFVANGFRISRELDSVIDEYAEELGKRAERPQEPPPDPEMIKAQAEQQRAQAEMELKQQAQAADIEAAQAKAKVEAQAAEARAAREHALKERELEAKLALAEREMGMRIELEREKARLEAELAREKADADIDLRRDTAQRDAEIKRQAAKATASGKNGKGG